MLDIGVITRLNPAGGSLAAVRELGLDTCQLCSWDPKLATRENAAMIVAEAKSTGVRICALWGGYAGPAVWNLTEGPLTIGLVPPERRAARVGELQQWVDFASWIGAPAVITHCGFIPENPNDPEFPGVVEAIRQVAAYGVERGVEFWFETGQETPVTLLRTIERVGTGNLGINLDPANLILYGKGNPVDALDVFGRYVRNVHVKDGFYPTDGDHLGKEAQTGEGKVDFPRFLSRLREIGFGGELIIEREIHGDRQRRDILATVANLRRWLGQ